VIAESGIVQESGDGRLRDSDSWIHEFADFGSLMAERRMG